MKLSSNVVSCTTGLPYPEEYKVYIDKINGTGFNAINSQHNRIIDYSGHEGYIYQKEPNEVTWYAQNADGIRVDWTVENLENKGLKVPYENVIDNINITKISSGFYAGQYEVTFGAGNASDVSGTNKYFFNYAWWSNHFCWTNNGRFHSGALVADTNNDNNYLNLTYRNADLGNVLNYLTYYVRNANIYVDGVLWSSANNTN